MHNPSSIHRHPGIIGNSRKIRHFAYNLNHLFHLRDSSHYYIRYIVAVLHVNAHHWIIVKRPSLFKHVAFTSKCTYNLYISLFDLQKHVYVISIALLLDVDWGYLFQTVIGYETSPSPRPYLEQSVYHGCVHLGSWGDIDVVTCSYWALPGGQNPFLLESQLQGNANFFYSVGNLSSLCAILPWEPMELNMESFSVQTLWGNRVM